VGQILLPAGQIPGESHDMLRTRVGFREHVTDIAQCLPDLIGKPRAVESALGIPTDLAGNENLPPASGNAIAVPVGPWPTRRLQYLVGKITSHLQVPRALFNSSRAMISFCTSVAPS